MALPYARPRWPNSLRLNRPGRRRIACRPELLQKKRRCKRAARSRACRFAASMAKKENLRWTKRSTVASFVLAKLVNH